MQDGVFTSFVLHDLHIGATRLSHSNSHHKLGHA